MILEHLVNEGNQFLRCLANFSQKPALRNTGQCKDIDSCHKISIVSGDSRSGAAVFFRNLFYRAVDNRIDFFLKETFHILVADGMQRA